MKTLHLAMIAICSLIGISSPEIASAMTANNTEVTAPTNPGTSNPVAHSNFTFPALHPSLPSYAAIHVAEPPDKTLPIVITGTLYKLFPNVIILKVQNPQGSLILISQLKPSSIGGFSLSFVPMAPLWSARGNYTVTVVTGSLELGSTAFFFNGTTYRTSPVPPAHNGALPLEQLRSGIKARNVTCNDDMQLIIKAEDGSPACVKHDTAQKLIERGWAKGPVGVSAMAEPSVELNNVTASLQPVILGMSFFVNANVTNNQDAPITYYGGCASPLSVKFDNIKTSTDGIHCLAESRYVLGPHESAHVQSEKINTVYNETGPDYAYAQVKFSYESNGTSSSQFASAEFPILHAIKLDCTEPFGTQMAKITGSVNVTRAIALAKSSPEFQSKIRQYGSVTYTDFYNDLYPAQSCDSYWKGIEVMFTANSENGTRNIRVTEDVGLTKVLKIEDFQAVLN